MEAEGSSFPPPSHRSRAKEGGGWGLNGGSLHCLRPHPSGPGPRQHLTNPRDPRHASFALFPFFFSPHLFPDFPWCFSLFRSTHLELSLLFPFHVPFSLLCWSLSEALLSASLASVSLSLTRPSLVHLLVLLRREREREQREGDGGTPLPPHNHFPSLPFACEVLIVNPRASRFPFSSTPFSSSYCR